MKLLKKYKTGIIAIVTLIIGFAVGANFGFDAGYEDGYSQTFADEESSTNSSEVVSDSDETVSVTEEEVVDDGSISEGMYKVGQDIPSGEYMLVSQGGGYFSINRDSAGSDSILANDNFDTHSFITIEDGQYLTLTRAVMYPKDKAPKIEPADGKLADGMYIVGVHLPAGEYKVHPNEGQDGYYGIYSGSSVSGLDNIIDNDNFNTERYITLKDGQYLQLTRATIILN
ncbi:hypothetical protein [Bacillus sp. CECT 9360]|uniref:hypothetical protein n=1 Tax=Bacillus sp. CECT 9360 TaxID=2845821 RepID=UPI001E2BCC81|nr:hypothetical protein [Bacillus sp. CECT 9360]CAH0344173.1 hypothetical protein BCI9360_00414 [Bacillus sp. CECT 9360]